MLINNQTGSTTLFSMLIFLAILVILLTSLRNHLVHYNDHLSAQKALSCLRRYTSLQRKYVNKMSQANRYIKMITIGSWSASLISIIFPGLSFTKISTKKALTLMKNYQKIISFKYLKNKTKLVYPSCPIRSINLTHYYQLSGLKFKRDRFGATILRRTHWTQKSIARKVIFSSFVQVKDAYQKIIYQSKMLPFGSKGALY